MLKLQFLKCKIFGYFQNIQIHRAWVCKQQHRLCLKSWGGTAAAFGQVTTRQGLAEGLVLTGWERSPMKLPSAAPGTAGKLPRGACAVSLALSPGVAAFPQNCWEETLTSVSRQKSLSQGPGMPFRVICFSRSDVRFLGSLACRCNPSWIYPPPQCWRNSSNILIKRTEYHRLHETLYRHSLHSNKHWCTWI